MKPSRAADAGRPSDVEILALADQCVKCGLCLPHCPTYRISQDEGESPRGRIALVEGWVRGDLATSPRLHAHLDQCLACRACELACPSLVAFGRLIDAARARRVAALPRWRRWIQRARLRGMGNQQLLSWTAAFACRYRRSLIGQRLEALGLHRWRAIRPFARLALVLNPPRVAPSRNTTPPDVDLLVGCAGAVAPGAAAEAATRVLQALGVRVDLSPPSACCGALYRHNGLPDDAEREVQRLLAARTDRPLIGVASACVAELRGQHLRAQPTELCAFLDQLPWPASVALAPLPRRVLVHRPCTHRLLPDSNLAVYRLLDRLPAVTLLELPGNDCCCGAAGTYMLDQPALAQTLLREKLEHLRHLAPAILVTTNFGCALHLAAGIRETGLAIEVRHPVELIDRQLCHGAADETDTGRSGPAAG